MAFRSPQTEYYFERFGYCPEQIASDPPADLGLVLVIPCYNEPNLVTALQALSECEAPACGFEIIVVANAGTNAPVEVLEQNQRTAEAARSWSGRHPLRVHLIDSVLPPKIAGVGLARKIGMDEALRRFDRVGRSDGAIVCFDADCTCDRNYLVEVERFFRANPKAPGCSLYFEHPLSGPETPEIYEAVTRYELHLRYYVEALRYARFPHAFHTIGSSMAVRANAYLKQGGMNKRQAGEDFYFLHKIIPLGHFGEVNSTRVIASPRPSDRVPFGTGRAVRSFLKTGELQSYPLQAFDDLRGLFTLVQSGSDLAEWGSLSPTLVRFLQLHQFQARVDEILEHSASPDSFRKRFFRWFDGFLAMKYIHFARDTQYGAADPVHAATELLKANQVPASSENARDLLLTYRRLQRLSPP